MPSKKKGKGRGLIIGGAVGLGVLAIAGVATAVAVGRKHKGGANGSVPEVSKQPEEPERVIAAYPKKGYYIKYLPISKKIFGAIVSNVDNTQYYTPQFPLTFQGFWQLDDHLRSHKSEYSGILSGNDAVPLDVGQANYSFGISTIAQFFDVNASEALARATEQLGKWAPKPSTGKQPQSVKDMDKPTGDLTGTPTAGRTGGRVPIGGVVGGATGVPVRVTSTQVRAQSYSATPGFEDYSYKPVVPTINISRPKIGGQTSYEQQYGCFKKLFGKKKDLGYPPGVAQVVPMGTSGINLESYRPADAEPGDIWMGPAVEWDWGGTGNRIFLMRRHYTDKPTGRVSPTGEPYTNRANINMDIAMRLFGWQSDWFPVTDAHGLINQIRMKEGVWNAMCPGQMGCVRVNDAYINQLGSMIKRHAHCCPNGPKIA